MSKREYDMMQVIKKHGLKTAVGLDALLTTMNDMLSENDDLPSARITAFANENGFTVGKAFVILIGRGLDAVEAERAPLPPSGDAVQG